MIRARGPGSFAALTGAALVIDDGRVAWTGPAGQAPAADESVDCGGRAVLPGFVDSHAHLVFAGERSSEIAARFAGASRTRPAGSAARWRPPGPPRTRTCGPTWPVWPGK